MGERHVGVDIGSFGVRAAEVSVDAGVPVLHRFAQITLPPGSVEHGEIVDGPAVTEAIKQLWSKGGFKTRNVVVGISSRDVKVRQAEVAALAPNELRGALRYETQDVIPFAGDDSLVDYLTLDRFTRDGVDMLRVLVVAAPRQRVDEAVAVLTAAGLRVAGVDLTPFALVRALASSRDPGRGEVIVSVGSSLTSVVVHAGGVPQMVRTTAGGGGGISDALADQLSVPFEQAEALKRSGPVTGPGGAQVAAVIDREIDALVGDVIGSVDYFVAQAAGVEVSRIVLTGAGSLVPGLRERIATEARRPVVPADALANVSLGRTKLSPEQLVAATSTLAVPIGLALAPTADPATRLTALLPQRYADRLRAIRESRIAAAAVGALVVVLLGAWVQRTFTVRAAHAGVTHTANLQRALQRREVAYAALAAGEARLKARATSMKTLLATDVDTTALLDRISAGMPTDVWIQTLSITFPAGKTPGSATFTLQGADVDAPAHWLTSMRGLTGTFTSVSVTSIAASVHSGHPGVTFSSQAVLAPSLQSGRAASFGVPK